MIDEPVSAPDAEHSTTLATYAVLSGLSMLIPVPFVDDAVRGRVTRRMVRALGDKRGVILSDGTIRTLGDDPPSPIARRVVGTIVTYPLKKFFRKTFLVLTGKEAIDTVSRTYHQGYLVDYSFARRWQESEAPERIRSAIAAACTRVGTSPIDNAVRAAWDASRDQIAGLSSRFFGAVGDSSAAADEQPEVRSLSQALRESVSRIPSVHFEELRASFTRELGPVTKSDV